MSVACDNDRLSNQSMPEQRVIVTTAVITVALVATTMVMMLTGTKLLALTVMPP